MNDIERELKLMLNERAGGVRGARDSNGTLRRARRRRVAAAGAAAMLSLVIATGAVAAFRGLRPDEAKEAAAPDGAGRYRFTSTRGEYPYVATGTFRDTEWGLRAARVALPPEADFRVTVMLTREGRNAAGSFELSEIDETLTSGKVSDAHVLGREVEVVFGAVTPDVAAVEIEIRDGGGTTIPAHVFHEHDAQAAYLAAGYYIAFVPRDAEGDVVALDRNGAVLDGEPLSEAGNPPERRG